MKKSYLTAVVTLACLLGVGISARSQATEGVRVSIPFEFVAGGTALPAGTYTVGRLSVEAFSGIEILGPSHGAFALPIAVDGAPVKQPKFSFEHVGDKYFLSEAETPGGICTFAVPTAMVTLAQKNYHSTTSSSGGN